MRNVYGLAVLLAAAVTGLPAAAQAPGRKIDVGGWTVADDRETDASFVSCTAEYVWDDRSAISLIKTLQYNAILLNQPTARLVTERKYPVSIQVDTNAQILAMAGAVDAARAIIPIEDPATMFAQISAGNTIWIQIDEIDYTISLKGSAAALKALEACYTAGTRSYGKSNGKPSSRS